MKPGRYRTQRSMNEVIKEKALNLLAELIEIPSFSKEEERTADLLEGFLPS